MTATDPETVFAREGARHRFTARRVAAVDVRQVAPSLVRVTFAGRDLADFTSTGPADHVRLFFPDPVTGALAAPVAVGRGEEGIIRPDGPSIARDFTPLPRRAGGSGMVDVDFFLHEHPGPASLWAQNARPGDELVMVGPRGSRGAPQAIDGIVLVCDETSLPSAGRWLCDVPAGTRADVVSAVAEDDGWVAEYLEAAGGIVPTVHAASDPDDLLTAFATLGEVGARTFVWAAGEASALVPLRRHLRRTLELPAAQVVISGYWRRGTSAFDHHSPVDPDDPD